MTTIVLACLLAAGTIGIVLAVAWWMTEKKLARAQALLAESQEARRAAEESIPVQRKAAVRQSRAINAGKITQDMAPLLPDWPYALKDSRQVGDPLDYIIFDGLANDAVQKIIFVEVKSGNSRMTSRQKQIMKAVEEGRVEFRLYSPETQGTATIESGSPAVNAEGTATTEASKA